MQTASYPIEAAEFGQRIKRRRAELGWSLAEVARRTGLSRAYVNALDMCANMHRFGRRAYLLDAMCAINGATPRGAA